MKNTLTLYTLRKALHVLAISSACFLKKPCMFFSSGFEEKTSALRRSAILPAAACLLLGIGTALSLHSCSEDIPTVSLGIDNEYYLPRMQSLRLSPALTGKAYRWIGKDREGRDSLLSTEHHYTFIRAEEGTYPISFEIVDPQTPFRHQFRIHVLHEEVEYSPYISRVVEYRPAPGQFINQMPQYEEGDTEEDMRRKAEESISGTNQILVSLGGWGGYITFRFDHTVMNRPGHKDFAIYGNAFYANTDPTQSGGSAEPGIVMVAYDRNGNGMPDPDEWYELAGSEYHKPTTLKNYSITYRRPDPDKPAVPGPGYIDREHIAWQDNQSQSGHIAQNLSHPQDYYPRWIAEGSLTFSGTLLPPNGTDLSGNGTYYKLQSYDYGYADNKPNSDLDGISFDIDWAVDANGETVRLPGADFIRVYTGVNQQCGWIGETSTEITQARDLNIPIQGLPNP